MKNKQETDKLFSERRQAKETDFPEFTEKIKTGLHLKFTIAITLVIVGIISVFFLFFHQIAVLSVQSESDHWGFDLAKSLARQLEQGVKPGAPAMGLLGQALLGLEAVAYVQVIYSDGIAKMHLVKHAEQEVTNLSADERLLQTPLKVIYSQEAGKNILEYRVPAKVKGTADTLTQQEVAHPIVRVGILKQSRHETKQLRSFTIAGLVALFVILGVGIAWLFSRIIIKPIQRLARAMKLVADETFEFDENGLSLGKRFRRVNDFELNIHTQDEIEQLADEFMVMLKKLEKSYQQLEEIIKDKHVIVQEKSKLAENLKKMNFKNEIIIKERTREVVEKNLRLYEIFEELQFQKEELISMNAQLERISRMKSEFLANMSHELRTPMNSILGFTEVLREKMFGELNEKQEKYLYNIPRHPPP